MPWNEVPGKFEAGQLHSGSSSGPKVKNRDQMIAIMRSEKRAAHEKPEYRAAMSKKLHTPQLPSDTHRTLPNDPKRTYR